MLTKGNTRMISDLPFDLLKDFLVNYGYTLKGTFGKEEFVLTSYDDLGIDEDNVLYRYSGGDPFPVTVTTEVDPNQAGDYDTVNLNDSGNISSLEKALLKTFEIGTIIYIIERGAYFSVESTGVNNGNDIIEMNNGNFLVFSNNNLHVDETAMGYSTDNTQEVNNAAVQRAFEIAVERNIELNINADITEGIVVTGNIKLGNIDIRASSLQSGLYALRFEGGDADLLPDLTPTLIGEDRTLEFTSAHNLSENDVICIFNPTDSSYSEYRTSYRDGEFARISKVISETEVGLDRTLYKDYFVTDIDVYKVNTIDVDRNGKFNVTYDVGNGLSNIRSVSFFRVKDTDLSNAYVKNNGGATALELNQCMGCSGINLRAIQNGYNGLTVAYGILFASCQDMLIDGYFEGYRHGSTTGSYGSICDVVNRNIEISGEFTSTDPNGTNFSADFHGNTEYCKYSGVFNDGILARGNHNKYRGLCRALSKGGNVLLDELSGYDHDFSGMKFFGIEDPLTGFNNRGAIDLNGNSNDGDMFAISGGEISLKDAVFDNVNCKRVINLIKKNTQNSDINLTGFKIVNSDTSGTLINVSSAGFSGEWGIIRARDLVYPSGSLFTLGSQSVKTEFSGVIEVNTGISTVSQVDLNFPHRFGLDDVPSVQVSYEGGFIGSILPQPFINSVRNQDVQIGVATPDSSNFNSDTLVNIHWTARVN